MVPGHVTPGPVLRPTDALAEDVVQEAWIAALRGLDGFEGRSRLRTWVLRIVTNIAKTWGEREHRMTPFSSTCVRRRTDSRP